MKLRGYQRDACTGRSCAAHAIFDAYDRAGRWRIATIEGVHADRRSVVTQHGIGESEDVASLATALSAVLDATPRIALIDHLDCSELLEEACRPVRSGGPGDRRRARRGGEAARTALHGSVPASVALVQAVIESRWMTEASGPRRLERTTLDGPALTGSHARFEALAGPER